MPITLTCLHCGKPFTVSSNRASQQFCSRTCKDTHTHIQKPCGVCGKLFECNQSSNIVTCGSEECKKAVRSGERSHFYGRRHPEELIKQISQKNTKPCIEVDCACGCGEKISVRPCRQRESKTQTFFVNPFHRNEYYIGRNHPRFRSGRVYYSIEWKKIAQSIRERDKICQHCGKTPEENGRALDVHHIIPARISRDNNPENLIALCKSCHCKATVIEECTEEYFGPVNMKKYRKCLYCDTVFLPRPYQKVCSAECKRQHELQYEREYRIHHPEIYQAKLQYNKDWYQTNKDYVIEAQREYRKRRRVQ